MNRKVIYTSLVGNYDSLRDPKYIIRNWDYICFSNNIKKRKIGIWEIRSIPFQHKDNLVMSRFPKINPHKVLKEYDYSLWIDANIEILDEFIERRINELIEKQFFLSLFPHPERDCIYKEAQICIEDGLDKKKIVEKQVDFLKSEKYPKNNGLFANGIIFRNHNDQSITSLGNDWWNLYLKFSKRDQLSLGYLLWKNKIHCEPFITRTNGQSLRNIPSIGFAHHTQSLIQRAKRYIRRNINNFS